MAAMAKGEKSPFLIPAFIENQTILNKSSYENCLQKLKIRSHKKYHVRTLRTKAID